MATVKVRIAVAVTPEGDWNACGWSGAESENDMMGICIESLACGEKRYWLEAELDVPDEPTVQASVAAA